METLHISTIDLILTRMMYEPLFAEDMFVDADSALTEYNLPPEMALRFKTISRPVFSAMTLEARKIFAQWVICAKGAVNPLDGKKRIGAFPCDLAVKTNFPLNKTNPKRRNKKMSQTDFQKLIDRVMSDEVFAKELASNPEATLKGIGVEATPEMLDAMKGVDSNALKQLASAFGDDRAAF